MIWVRTTFHLQRMVAELRLMYKKFPQLLHDLDDRRRHFLFHVFRYCEKWDQIIHTTRGSYERRMLEIEMRAEYLDIHELHNFYFKRAHLEELKDAAKKVTMKKNAGIKTKRNLVGVTKKINRRKSVPAKQNQ